MKVNNRFGLLVSVFLITLVTLFVYRGILFPPAGVDLYPWGSDTLGHVLKGEYLKQKIAEGDLRPDLLPKWYMGLQLFRYYAPLPYYLLVSLMYVIGDSVAAANWFIALCALLGGLAWLFYRRWIGLLPATLGGALYTFLPDNVRVALAEGNLPRVLATALLPLTIYFLLRVLEKRGARWHWLGLALCFAVVVLSHAMMAAIYAACCVLLAWIYWLGRTTRIKRVIISIISVILGIMLSGWWLLPSLVGGITELNVSAMTEALAVFPLMNYLNPALRTGDPEAVYVGAALLVLAVAAPFVKHGRNRQAVALTLTGLFGVLITTPGFNDVFNALPLHNLLWPLRFLGVASFMLLLALMWRVRAWSERSPLLVGIVVAFLAADNAGSLSLIHLRPARQEVLEVSRLLPELNGWREATLDDSRLGSAAPYFFTANDGREQIYGWAYQGARTARNVAALSEAIRRGHTVFVVDRLAMLGADDVVLLNEIVAQYSAEASEDPDVLEAPSLLEALAGAGFKSAYTGADVTLYHRDGGSRAYRADWRVLGIGRTALNLAYIFPQVVVGKSKRVDDYALDELLTYDAVVLAGFEWQNQGKAEKLVRQAAERGVNIFVDLIGSPEDPLARLPRFLGVWGERLVLSVKDTAVLVKGPERNYQLQPFELLASDAVICHFCPGNQSVANYWYADTPQGLDADVFTFDYVGEDAVIAGYKTYGTGRVWFVGANLFYHAVLTRDPVAIQILSDLLKLPPDTPSDYASVPLEHYVADQNGYEFTYKLEASDTLLVPVARFDGTIVTVDGVSVATKSFENLVAFEAPAGEHQVEIRVRPTRIYLVGWIVSGLAIFGLLGLFFWEHTFFVQWRRKAKDMLPAPDVSDQHPFDTGVPA